MFAQRGWHSIGILLTIVCLLGSSVIAQDSTDNVYVTTQKNLVLRLGPGANWSQITIVPFGTTLQAVGRSVYTDWIQVAYDQPLAANAPTDNTIDGISYGWLNTRFLVWTGILLELPIDGISFTTTARREAAQITIDASTIFYDNLIEFGNPVPNTITDPITVEVTGRVGGTQNGFYWLQFLWNGNYYWTSTWVSHRTFDGSYLYAFGRLYDVLRRTANRTSSRAADMQYRWQDLASGFAATCNLDSTPIAIPEEILPTGDLAEETTFTALATTLMEAIRQTNIAIAQLQAVCDRPIESRFATPDDVAIGLAATDSAAANINMLSLLLTGIGPRHPIANNKPQ